MLRTILYIILFLWLLGFIFNIAGGFIHLLLVAVVILFLIDFIGGRRL